jgi:2-polyprenyl-6-methoxyphenol hydroxylase-like FAD-dependent oxidoreductase
MGIAPAVLARGGTLDGLRFYGPGRPEPLLTFRLRGLAELHTPYPFVWLLPQDKVETPLLDHLDRLGGAVERGRELVAFREQDGHVEADVRAVSEPAGPVETIRAKWLVGCDGAHSRVRHGLDLFFAGTTSDERFLLADVEANWTREDQLGHAWVSDAGLLALLRLHGTAHWRLIATVEGDDAATEPSLALVQRLFRERTGDQTTQLSNPLWLSRFTIHRRMVDRYKVGRVLLAGDAAHVHSPVGGQG